MANAAPDFGYDCIGIPVHSQSLKIARAVPVEDLWKQICSAASRNPRLLMRL
jgi:hypothetical protein